MITTTRITIIKIIQQEIIITTIIVVAVAIVVRGWINATLIKIRLFNRCIIRLTRSRKEDIVKII
jgi:hypothetical protein